MNKSDIIKRAFVNAMGVVAYVTVFAFSVINFEKVFGPQTDGWINIALFLILFIISASVTGSLVLMKPIMLFMDGKRREAMHMFAYTVGFLAILAIVISLVIGIS